jgi:lipopolysaccharide/colanic/teichoic acid biosynthesis glycosyltransferase
VIKRSFDVAVAALVLILGLPLMLAVAASVAINLGRPVLFRQRRPGKHGRPFEMVKFRSMRDAVDASGRPLPDEARLTSFGRLLRASSLDELPELWNVLKGDMSLVGPRPLLMQYLDRYTRRQARRMEVRPGITGWAQVNGRNALSWEERFEMDVWYVDNRSFWLDLRILALTALKVVRRDGVSAAGHATMPEFMGAGDRRTGPRGERD